MSDRGVTIDFAGVLGPVTYHAVARYLDRVAGHDLPRVRRSMAQGGCADLTDGAVVRWLARGGAIDLDAVVRALLTPAVRLSVERTAGCRRQEVIRSGRLRVVVVAGFVVTVSEMASRKRRCLGAGATRRRRDRLRREAWEAVAELA